MTAILTGDPRPDLQEHRLFEPTEVAGLRLRNRFVMAPMTRERADHGVPSADAAEYYRRRACGGVGLIVTEGIAVDERTAHHDGAIPRLSGAALPIWRSMVDGVHEAGARVAAQLWHLGGEYEAGRGSTPSGRAPDGSPNGRAMTPADIDRVVFTFAEAARNAKSAGFDAVEIHGAHGYLIHEFLWPATNRRTDGYGGTPVARARLAAEIVSGVRSAVGPAFPVILRLSQFAERDYSTRIASGPAELGQMLQRLAEAGADVLHASQRRFWEPPFPDAHPSRNLAGWARMFTGLPTITVGSVGLTSRSLRQGPSSLAALSTRLNDGELDLVAVGRPLLRTPDWVDRARAGRLTDQDDYARPDEQIYP